MTTGAMVLRRAVDGDTPAVLDLLSATMGWERDEGAAQMFEWKHRANVFGVSPAWVALDGDRVVAFRTFMRWRFCWDGELVDAVRAVDTVTHPEYQGRGLFKSLTLEAVRDLTAEGVAFVFNTPNEQSRPGYLKMGWKEMGRLPVGARPRGLGALIRMLRARRPAELLSIPTLAGDDPLEAFAAGRPPTDARRAGLTTERSGDYLRWRYGFGPLAYRVWTDDGTGYGVVFRLRRRGGAVELAVVETLGEPTTRLLTRLLAATRADYAIGLGVGRPPASVRFPGQGPVLTWRGLAVSETPDPDSWRLTLGDVELF